MRFEWLDHVRAWPDKYLTCTDDAGDCMDTLARWRFGMIHLMAYVLRTSDGISGARPAHLTWEAFSVV